MQRTWDNGAVGRRHGRRGRLRGRTTPNRHLSCASGSLAPGDGTSASGGLIAAGVQSFV